LGLAITQGRRKFLGWVYVGGWLVGVGVLVRDGSVVGISAFVALVGVGVLVRDATGVGMSVGVVLVGVVVLVRDGTGVGISVGVVLVGVVVLVIVWMWLVVLGGMSIPWIKVALVGIELMRRWLLVLGVISLYSPAWRLRVYRNGIRFSAGVAWVISGVLVVSGW
jgi:hypothetical protein